MFVEALRRDTEALQYALGALQTVHGRLIACLPRTTELLTGGRDGDDSGSLGDAGIGASTLTAGGIGGSGGGIDNTDGRSHASSSLGSGVGPAGTVSSESAAWEVRCDARSGLCIHVCPSPRAVPLLLPRCGCVVQEGDDGEDEDGDYALEGVHADMASKAVRA